MRFIYGKQDLPNLAQTHQNGYLLTNGLGGYQSMTAAFSAPRADQGILVAAVTAPNDRMNLVHRLQESVQVGEKKAFLSTQSFADGKPAEDGFRHLSFFCFDALPQWTYDWMGLQINRRCVMAQGKNLCAVLYEIQNRTQKDCVFTVRPFCKFAPKEHALCEKIGFSYENGVISANDLTLHIKTDGEISSIDPVWQMLAYPEDDKDGRPAKGLCAAVCRIERKVPAGETVSMQILFSTEKTEWNGETLCQTEKDRLAKEEKALSFSDPAARQLAMSAAAFIAHRDSTGGKTILAGYPLFSDWGRDTMIALPGCCLSTGRYEDAKSILRTFFAYEKDGLVPNLFPEGDAEPMYNTVDAALLLIDCVWQYHQRTGDDDFVKEAFPVMKRIISAYKTGTHHNIGMDEDGLIHAGQGLDQVTWMDVRIDGILPTPRHGKPVEINAYWYNALRIMQELSPLCGEDGSEYGDLSEQVKASFCRQFYIPEKGYLRDVVSGTSADEQLRCNQIWAVSMPFTMLTPSQQRSVVSAVYEHLYTPCGLRTLSPDDKSFHPFYGGSQKTRDMAYHQGTVWTFPLGGYYLAYLKVNGYSRAAAETVRRQLCVIEPMLRQGCAGFLPEIYDGETPTDGKGCFAQAWSVGEILRVFEKLEEIENERG